jgi:hypothetical protein
VAQLEKKLDDLVALLTAPKGQGEHIEQPHLAESVSPLRSTSPTSAHQTRQVSSFPERIPGRQMGLDSPQRIIGAFSSTSSPQRLHPPEISGSRFSLPNQEDAFFLLEFRTSLAPQFPFVVIPPEATSESLRRERPMLWKAILTAASCYDPSRREAMGWELIEEFSTRLLLKAEKSLDLLQALLIHLAWLVALFSYLEYARVLSPLSGWQKLERFLTIEQVSLSFGRQSASDELIIFR